MNEAALRTYFWDVSRVQFALGHLDCVRFVTEAVLAGWGRDFTSILMYDDRKSAVRRLRELGGLKGACSHAMGGTHSIDDLAPGDVVWFDKPATIGLLMPGYVAVKSGRCIHRLVIEPQMIGWQTNGR